MAAMRILLIRTNRGRFCIPLLIYYSTTPMPPAVNITPYYTVVHSAHITYNMIVNTRITKGMKLRQEMKRNTIWQDNTQKSRVYFFTTRVTLDR